MSNPYPIDVSTVLFWLLHPNKSYDMLDMRFQQVKTGNAYRILVETLKAFEDISKMDCTFVAKVKWIEQDQDCAQ